MLQHRYLFTAEHRYHNIENISSDLYTAPIDTCQLNQILYTLKISKLK